MLRIGFGVRLVPVCLTGLRQENQGGCIRGLKTEGQVQQDERIDIEVSNSRGI